MIEIPCIVCGKLLEDAIPDDPPVNQPHGATVFYSHGQYGSTAFDEVNGTFLEINACDPCLLAAAAKGWVLHGTPDHRPAPAPLYRTWKPEAS